MTRRAEPPIAEHGLIGDLQTAALVSTDGAIDWLCMPRFDSPSVFGSLLDPEKGGYCRIHPATEGYTSRQLYLPDSAVLVTRFMSEEGVAEVIDFMPISDEAHSTEHHRVVRIVRVVRGQMRLEFELFPAFDYGRERRGFPLPSRAADRAHRTVAGAKQTAADRRSHRAWRADQRHLEGG
jgi:GH15 family glucan-1,4-alpha-glucosidase